MNSERKIKRRKIFLSAYDNQLLRAIELLPQARQLAIGGAKANAKKQIKKIAFCVFCAYLRLLRDYETILSRNKLEEIQAVGFDSLASNKIAENKFLKNQTKQ